MADKLIVAVDLNVVLDVLARRQPYFTAASQLWMRIERRDIRGLIAAHSLTTLFYLISRHSGNEQAASAVRDVLEVYEVAAVDQAVLESALSMGWSDFEDAVQMAAAVKAGADYLVTRNPDDFEGGPIPVLQPGEFLPLLGGDLS
jgi:predicted nucleic acid-binding protein